MEMSKREKRMMEETELLYNHCKEEPRDVEFIMDCLALQKTKTLLVKKRGLQSDIDNLLNQFISAN
jgi:DNA sulfur modification protein DndC